MRTTIGLVLGLLAMTASCVGQAPAVQAQASEGPAVQIVKEEGADALKVLIYGEHFTTYHYSNDNMKPFLWPVLGEGGMPVTRAYPMGPEEEKADHPHHKSIWTSYGDVNGVDCWAEGENAGRQVSGTPEFASGDEFGSISVTNTWVAKDGTPVLIEAREYRFYPGSADGRMFDVTVTFTASQGDVLFRDTKEGGILSVRVRDKIRVESGGAITTETGGPSEKECWGKPSPWCDYSGPLEDGKVRGIAVFDHPSNLRHPTRWHVRNYGLMGANCFGLSHFTKDEPEQLNGDYTLKAGESLTFKYRVLVHSGTASEAGIAQKYQSYAGK